MADALQLANRHTGERLKLTRQREPDGGEILCIEGSLPPRASGPPPHVHWAQHEQGKVISGTLGARCGKEQVVVRAGGSAAFPAGVVHAWWNAGEELLVFAGHVRPAGDLDRFLQAIFAVANASPSGRPSLFHLVEVLWRHREQQSVAVPPRAVQRVLFPLVLALGWALGRTRDPTRPSAPANCPGAPAPASVDSPPG